MQACSVIWECLHSLLIVYSTRDMPDALQTAGKPRYFKEFVCVYMYLYEKNTELCTVLFEIRSCSLGNIGNYSTYNDLSLCHVY